YNPTLPSDNIFHDAVSEVGGRSGLASSQKGDAWAPGRCLGGRREWPRRRRAAEQRDELPALHLRGHSITSSARPGHPPFAERVLRNIWPDGAGHSALMLAARITLPASG